MSSATVKLSSRTLTELETIRTFRYNPRSGRSELRPKRLSYDQAVDELLRMRARLCSLAHAAEAPGPAIKNA